MLLRDIQQLRDDGPNTFIFMPDYKYYITISASCFFMYLYFCGESLNNHTQDEYAPEQ